MHPSATSRNAGLDRPIAPNLHYSCRWRSHNPHGHALKASTIALLLPLSDRLRDAGEALRDGFLTAFYDQPASGRPQIGIYDVGTDAADAYRRAIAEGATHVVGPLSKEHVGAIRKISDPRVTTLALNTLTDDEPVPGGFFQFGLSPEDESRAVAERLLAEGKTSGAALVIGSEWGTRVLASFQSHFQTGGGKLVVHRPFANTDTDFTPSVDEILGFEPSQKRHDALVSLLKIPLQFAPRRRDDVEFVFFAGPPVSGRLMRQQFKFHYAPDLPIYATSDVFDPNPVANQDLDGVAFVDMPWMIGTDPTLEGLRTSAARVWPGSARIHGRLFAMGIDAYRLIQALRNTESRPLISLAGATGLLSIDASGRVHRTLEWAIIGTDGSPHALPALATT